MKKRVFSIVLCLVMLCSVLSVGAFAAEEGTVTVYITTGMFTEGTPTDPQHYKVGVDPALHLLNGNEEFKQSVTLADIEANLSNTQRIYHGVVGQMRTPNLLDAICVALGQAHITYGNISGGWDTDSYNGGVNPGGYISSFTPGGVPVVNDPKTEIIDNVEYTVYSGTGWQIAYGTAVSNIAAIDLYGTNYEALNGQIIVFDLSPYAFYYEN